MCYKRNVVERDVTPLYVDSKEGFYIVEFVSREKCEEIEQNLANQIHADYQDKDLLFTVVEKGAAVYAMSVFQKLNLPQAELEFVQTTSYQNAESSGVVSVLKGLEQLPIAGRNVLIVEDIIDTGLTMDELKRRVAKMPTDARPASLKVCSFLSKPSRRKVDMDVDYLGLEIPDIFVVGRGLDYNQRFRSLNYLGAVHPF